MTAAPIDRQNFTGQHFRTRERGNAAQAREGKVSPKGGDARRQDDSISPVAKRSPSPCIFGSGIGTRPFTIGCSTVCPGPPIWTERIAGGSLLAAERRLSHPPGLPVRLATVSSRSPATESPSENLCSGLAFGYGELLSPDTGSETQTPCRGCLRRWQTGAFPRPEALRGFRDAGSSMARRFAYEAPRSPSSALMISAILTSRCASATCSPSINCPSTRMTPLPSARAASCASVIR